MGWPITLNGRVYTLSDFEGNKYVEGFPDALEDFVAQAAAVYKSTSTSSITVGTGAKSLTAEPGKPWGVGAPLRVARTSAPTTTYMDVIVTNYDAATGAMTVEAVAAVGSGTYSDWSIYLGATRTTSASTLPVPVNEGGTGSTTATDARTNLDVYGKSEVYSRSETYSKSEVYSRSETYSKSEVDTAIAANRGLEAWAVKGAAYTATAGARIAADTATAAWTLTLPASPADGDEVLVSDRMGTWDTNNLTVDGNGLNIVPPDGTGAAATFLCNVTGWVLFVYDSAAGNWRIRQWG